MFDIIIIGGGPAGLTAAIYCRRAGKTVLVIEKDTFGGQITWSPRVENFPGFISISGTELGDKLTTHAMELGAETELGEVIGIEKKDGFITIRTDMDEEYNCKALIIATGAKPKMLGLPEEDDYLGNGECFCAVCDGAFYADEDVAVNGGGNAALQEALHLSEICRTVYLIHRRSSFRGEEQLVNVLKEKANVRFILNSTVVKLKGENELEAITVSDDKGIQTDIEVKGLFVAIGREPDNLKFSQYLKLDEKGYINAIEDCKTDEEWLFIAGDCRNKKVRQLTTAVSDGAVAALAACEYVDKNG